MGSSDRSSDDKMESSKPIMHNEHPEATPVTPPAAGGELEQAIPHTPQLTEDALSTPQTSGLFGRGLLYVVVWSLQTVAGLVVSPVLAHILDVSEFGFLASAIALHQVLIVLAVLGLDQALMLRRLEEGDDRSARGLISAGVVMTIIAMALLAITGPLWSSALGFGHFSSLVVAVILWTAPAAAVQVMLALLLAEDRLRPFALVSALSAVGGQVIGLVLLFVFEKDATTYAWGAVTSQTVAMLVGFYFTRPTLRGLVDWRTAWHAVRLGAPFAVSALAAFVLNAGDRIVIQRLLGAAEVGRYQIAYTLGWLVILLLTFTNSAWAPRFLAVRDASQRWALSAQSRDQIYQMLIPILLGITLGAPIGLRIIAPATFAPDSLLIVVYLIALTAFPVAASGATGRLLFSLRRGKALAVIAGVGAVANLLMNIVLVPVIGIAGAAAATLLAFWLIAFLQLRALPSSPAWRRPPTPLLWAVLGAVVAAGASILVQQSTTWNIVRLVLALACLPWLLVYLRQAQRGPKDLDSATGPFDG